MADFTKWDGQVTDASGNEIDLMFFNEEKPVTKLLPLQQTKLETGNPLEKRPEYGDVYGQNDFRGGSGQKVFHKQGRDETAFFESNGIDITEEGRAFLHHAVDESFSMAEGGDVTIPARIEQFNGLLFASWGGRVTNPNEVHRHSGTFPGTWTAEDTDDGESGSSVAGPTRFYFQNAAAPFNPALDTDWTATTAANRRALAKTKSGALSNYATAFGAASGTRKMHVATFVSAVLATGTVFATSDTLSAVFEVMENDPDLNAFLAIVVKVMASDNTTTRATLYDNTASGTDVEWDSDYEGRIRTAVALSAGYTTVANDYLVVEVGYRATTVDYDTPAIARSAMHFTNGSNLSWGGSTTAGNLLVVVVSATGSSDIPAIAAASGYTLAVSVTDSTTRQSIFYKENAASETSTGTFTVTAAGPYTAFIQGAEVSGIEPVSPLDKTASTSGTGTSLASGTTAATTQAKEFWFAAVTQVDPSAIFSSPSDGFTLLSQGGPGSTLRQGSALKVVSATGAASTTLTSSLSAPYLGAIATFKARATNVSTAEGRVSYGGTGTDPALTSGVARDSSSGWVEFSNGFQLAAEATPTKVYDLAAKDEYLYAAEGPNGIHRRTVAGVWAHYSDAQAKVIATVKDRLMAASDTALYEITASGAAPTPLDSVGTGWKWLSIFEAGPYIYAIATNEDLGRSVIYHYGNNAAGSALEAKGSTAMPIGQLAYVGESDQGLVFIGAGRISEGTASDPYARDPVLYVGLQQAGGELALVNAGEDDEQSTESREIRAICPVPNRILVGWNVEGHSGLAFYDPAREAFANHLQDSAIGSRRITGITFYEGHIVYVIPNVGVLYENLDERFTEGVLVTSLADWGNAGQKLWDEIELTCLPLPANCSIETEYTTGDPDDEAATWTSAGTLTTDGATSARYALSNVTGRRLTLRFTLSTSDGLDTPTLTSYSVRSYPKPEVNEYLLKRYVRLGRNMKKNDKARSVSCEPRTVRKQLLALGYSRVTFTEEDATWSAKIEDISDFEPAQPNVRETDAENQDEFYVVELTMVARLTL